MLSKPKVSTLMSGFLAVTQRYGVLAFLLLGLAADGCPGRPFCPLPPGAPSCGARPRGGGWDQRLRAGRWGPAVAGRPTSQEEEVEILIWPLGSSVMCRVMW